jgi:hypothetical protein
MTTTVLNSSMPTLLDLVKRQDPNGAQAKIIEVLTSRNPMLEDMAWREGNLTTGHRVTSRTSLPSPTWRRINEGVGVTKSTTGQVDESCGMMEGYSAVDAELVRLNGGAGFRATEDAAFIQAFNNELATGVIYHSTHTAPEKIQGLAARYSSTTCAAKSQIVLSDAAADGSDNTSVWCVCWGEGGVYGIVPKGMPGGLQHKDLGELAWDASDSTAAAPKKFQAFVSHWQMRAGLVVEDWRQAARVGNIDVAKLVSDAATGSDLVDSMIRAYHKIGNPNAGRMCWYVNRTVATYLHLQALAKSNSTITVETIAGKPVTTFLGAPVRTTDAITDAEDALV